MRKNKKRLPAANTGVAAHLRSERLVRIPFGDTIEDVLGDPYYFSNACRHWKEMDLVEIVHEGFEFEGRIRVHEVENGAVRFSVVFLSQPVSPAAALQRFRAEMKAAEAAPEPEGLDAPSDIVDVRWISPSWKFGVFHDGKIARLDGKDLQKIAGKQIAQELADRYRQHLAEKAAQAA